MYFFRFPDITRWHCTRSLKVAGSFPDGVTGIFYWLNYSARTGALKATQSLTETSRKDLSWVRGWGWEGQCVGLPTLSPSCGDCLEIRGAPTSWTPTRLSSLVMGELYLKHYSLFFFSDLQPFFISFSSVVCQTHTIQHHTITKFKCSGMLRRFEW
jgi:hypothetical protein